MFGEGKDHVREELECERNNNTNFNERCNQAQEAISNQDVNHAIQIFQSLLEIRPEDASLHNNLGVLFYKTEDFKSAEASLQKAIQLNPRYADPHFNLAKILLKSEKNKSAILELERCLIIKPEHEKAKALLNEIQPELVSSGRKKLAVCCLPGFDHFLSNIVEFLKTKYEVKTCYSIHGQEIDPVVHWADIVWLEWANEMAVTLTNHSTLLNGKSVICRLHSYEAFGDFIKKIRWEKIHHTIFVAPHIRGIVLDQVKALSPENTSIVPNGVDLDQFSFRERRQDTNLAYLGLVNHKKGPMLLLHAFFELVQRDDRYRLFMAGGFQESRYRFYFDHMIREMGLENHISISDWIKDVPSWLEDKHYIVSTSPLEGHPVGIMEAMACGIKPVIHNFVGAKDIYPAKYVWNTIPEFVSMIIDPDYDSTGYRNFIFNNYSLKKQLKELDYTINRIDKKSNKKNDKKYNGLKQNKLYDEEELGIKIKKDDDSRESLFGKVTIGIVVKERLFNLEVLINSLYREYKNFHLIIVVNGSKDECLLEYIDSIGDKEGIHILRLADHRYCAGAREVLTRYYLDKIATDFLVYLDDDMMMEKYALSKMLKYAENYQGVLCFRLKYINKYISQAGKYDVKNGQFYTQYPHRQFKIEKNSIYEGDLVTHGCSMFPLEVLKKVPFPEGYSQGFEDYYHSIKLKEAKIKVWGIPVDVIHYSYRLKHTDIDMFRGIIQSARKFYSDTRLYSEYFPDILARPNINKKELKDILSGDKKPDELFSKTAPIMKGKSRRAVFLVAHKNAGRYLRYCVHSLQMQTYKNMLIVILDDESDDSETVDIMKNLSQDEVVIIERFGKGKLGNWVEALNKNCKEDDVVFLVDGDDGLLYIDAVEKIMEVYNSRSDFNFVYSGLWNANEGCEQFGYNPTEYFATHLRSFKYDLWRKADKTFLFNPKTGKYWESAVDRALMTSLLFRGIPAIGIESGCYYYRNYLESNNHNDDEKQKLQRECHKRLNQLIQEKRSGEKKISIDTRVLSPGDFKALFQLASRVPNGGKILELGSFSGNSTMALLLATNGKAIEIHCVDTWEGSLNDNTRKWYEQSDIFTTFKQNTEKVNDNPKRIHVHKMKTSEFGFSNFDFFDMIFIDASHEEEDVYADILNSMSCLKPDGILCGHDWGKKDFPGVTNAIQKADIDVEVFPNSSVWIRKNEKATSKAGNSGADKNKSELNWTQFKTTASSSPKRILYIVSGTENSLSSYPFAFKEKRFPMGIAYLSAILKENGHHVELLDRYLQSTAWRDDLQTFDFVGVYVSSPTRGDAYHILEEINKLKSRPVVAVGGPHCSYPDEKLDSYCDYKVIGEAEGIIAPLVAGEIDKNTIIRTDRIVALDNIPRADYSLFEGMPYQTDVPFDRMVKPVWVMNTSRGCPFRCSFCQLRDIWGIQYCAQSAERIIEDIKYLQKKYEIEGVYFREDNFTFDRKRLKKFCEISSDLDIKWFAESRADISLNLLKKMKKAGCRGLYVGVENGSQRMLDIFNKNISAAKMKEFLLNCKDVGIPIAASIIRNHPQELADDILKTDKLLAETEPTLVWENPWREPGKW